VKGVVWEPQPKSPWDGRGLTGESARAESRTRHIRPRGVRGQILMPRRMLTPPVTRKPIPRNAIIHLLLVR